MIAVLRVCPCVAEHAHKSTVLQSPQDTTQITNDIFSGPEIENPTTPKRKYVYGKVALGVTGAVALGIVAITTPFVTPALRKICLPYVPATERQIANVLQFCRQGKQSTLVDLGSGDGRVVLAAARCGYRAHGIELNPWLVLYSNLQARWHGLSHLATFSRQDLWKVNLAKYENIVIFGVSEMMTQLQEKVQNEASDETHVIACRFPFTSWTPKGFIPESIDSVWLYRKPFTGNP